ncbi:MAG: 50S ribosomal protein L4 [Gammaproteobacteria bacterium]
MKLSLANSKTTVDVSDDIFACEYNEDLVHQAVTAYLAGGRQGTKANKSRSDVRGGGAKPWRQKGTGRARAGTSNSPIWRSGGVTFAARPRNYKQKINKKMVRAAYASMFSELVRQERIHVVEDFAVSEPKTKQALELLGKLSVSSALVITEEADKNLYLSVRNLPHIDVTEVGGLDPVSLVKYENVIITKDALGAIEEWLQ